MPAPKTLFEKIWSAHVIEDLGDGRAVIHIDRHVVQEVTSWQAFDGLRKRGLKVHNLGLTYGVIDHSCATSPGRTAETFEPTRKRIEAMRRNCAEFGVELYDINDPNQGIVHVIAPELGIALPGSTYVCGDSHSATAGGVGAWALGIGSTQILQTLATQALVLHKGRTMRINFDGALPPGTYAKDLILYLIGRHGIAAGTGHVVEYAGSAIRAMPVEGRMTISNMSVEFGARSGLVGVDDTTLEYVEGRRFAPSGKDFERAAAEWRRMRSDEGAIFDREIDIDCTKVRPQVSWGTTPQDIIAVDEPIPTPGSVDDPERRQMMERALKYMGLVPGRPLEGLPIDVAFIGSCTNSRLSDLQEAARVVKGRKVPEGVRALVVPGSTQVKTAAEALGLDKVFREAGFEWRESGCSMCLSTNGDIVPPGRRSISTSNRNFEHRQGTDSRTHLASPAMVAAAAISGCITDIRKLGA
jgi:3-isopropylmalate/(R)-2-methylmalate dehydratase large subunit